MHDGERRRIGPVRLPVRARDPLRAPRLRDRVLHAGGHDHAHAATSSSTSRPSTGATPTWRCSARSPSREAACGCCSRTRRTPSARVHAVGVDGRARRCASLFREHPDKRLHRRELRVAPAPREQVARRRDRRRPQGRVPRPVDAAQHRDGPRARCCSTCRSSRSSTSTRSAASRPTRCASICTGSQGEPMSALVADGRARAQAREGLRRRRRRALGARDPGQRVERVARDRLAAPGRRRGRARTARRRVHVSGHASQEELKFLLNLLSPEWFVPVHGEYRHLVHHARLAEDVGVAARAGAHLRGRRRDRARRRRRRRRTPRGARGLHVRRRHRRRRRPRRAARPARARGGGRGRRDRHRRARSGRGRSPGPRSSRGAGSTRPRPRICSRTRRQVVLGAIDGASEQGATDFETVRRHARTVARQVHRRAHAAPPDRHPGGDGGLRTTLVASTIDLDGRRGARDRRRERRRRRDRPVVRARGRGRVGERHQRGARAPRSRASRASGPGTAHR